MKHSDSRTDLVSEKPRKPLKGHNFILLVHGGAGVLSRDIPASQQELYKQALVKALKEGYQVLRDGGESMDAVTAAVTVLEDCPLFNAGKGAVFNRAGKNELEASIMLSKPPLTHPEILHSRRGAAATLLMRIRNPSQLVRALYLAPQITPHVFLSSGEAERIGSEALGQTLVDPSYFWTEKRWREHRRGLGLPEEPIPHPPDDSGDPTSSFDSLPKGTVGAVALDMHGCIAVSTSTGGLTNKIVGRIGDTPLMGSGFWAEEWTVKGFWKRTWHRLFHGGSIRSVGVSGTGDGDYFIRGNTASSVASLMKYSHKSLRSASETAVKELGHQGGSGGLIAVDNRGNYAMPLNSGGMFRGVIKSDGLPLTAIFDDEILS